MIYYGKFRDNPQREVGDDEISHFLVGLRGRSLCFRVKQRPRVSSCFLKRLYEVWVGLVALSSH